MPCCFVCFAVNSSGRSLAADFMLFNNNLFPFTQFFAQSLVTIQDIGGVVMYINGIVMCIGGLVMYISGIEMCIGGLVMCIAGIKMYCLTGLIEAEEM